MTTFFVGGGFDCWLPTVTGCSDSANAISIHNGAHADAILRDPATGAGANATEVWFHSELVGSSYRSYDSDVVEFNDAAGVTRARLRMSGDGVYHIEWYDGAAWHEGPQVVNGPLTATVDIRVKIAGGTDGYIGWFINAVLASELAGIDTSSMGTIRSCRVFSRYGYYDEGSWQNTVIASYNTVGHTVRRRQATGNGPEQDWAGDYTSINEDGTNDSTAITATTDNEVSNFSAGALSPTPAGSIIKSVAIGSRIRASGDEPTHVQAVLTVSGTDYTGQGIVGSVGYTPAVTCFDVDPSTGVAWASIDAINGDYGVKAAA